MNTNLYLPEAMEAAAAVDFDSWLDELRENAGEPYLRAINRIGAHILETFCEEGCEPSLDGVIRHCEYDSLRPLETAEPEGPEPTPPFGSALAAT